MAQPRERGRCGCEEGEREERKIVERGWGKSGERKWKEEMEELAG